MNLLFGVVSFGLNGHEYYVPVFPYLFVWWKSFVVVELIPI